MLVFRNAAELVSFNVINPVTARLLALLQDGNRSGRETLLNLAAELQHPEPGALVNFGAGILENLRAEGEVLGAVIGTNPANSECPPA